MVTTKQDDGRGVEALLLCDPPLGRKLAESAGDREEEDKGLLTDKQYGLPAWGSGKDER